MPADSAGTCHRWCPCPVNPRHFLQNATKCCHPKATARKQSSGSVPPCQSSVPSVHFAFLSLQFLPAPGAPGCCRRAAHVQSEHMEGESSPKVSQQSSGSWERSRGSRLPSRDRAMPTNTCNLRRAASNPGAVQSRGSPSPWGQITLSQPVPHAWPIPRHQTMPKDTRGSCSSSAQPRRGSEL